MRDTCRVGARGVELAYGDPRVAPHAEPLRGAHSSDLPRKVDSIRAEQIAAARREGHRSGSVLPQRGGTRPAKKLRATLMWLFVLGLPVLCISALVASMIVHDPAKEPNVYMGPPDLSGTSKAEDVLAYVGLVGLATWIVGCFVLIVAVVIAEKSADADRTR